MSSRTLVQTSISLPGYERTGWLGPINLSSEKKIGKNRQKCSLDTALGSHTRASAPFSSRVFGRTRKVALFSVAKTQSADTRENVFLGMMLTGACSSIITRRLSFLWAWQWWRIKGCPCIYRRDMDSRLRSISRYRPLFAVGSENCFTTRGRRFLEKNENYDEGTSLGRKLLRRVVRKKQRKRETGSLFWR